MPYMDAMFGTVHHPHVMGALHHWVQLDLVEILLPAPEISLRDLLLSPSNYPAITTWLLTSWLNELRGLVSACRYLELFAHPESSAGSWTALCNNIRPESTYVMRLESGHFALQIAELRTSTTDAVIGVKANPEIANLWLEGEQAWYLRDSDDPRTHGIRVFASMMLEIIIFVTLTTAPDGANHADSGVMTGTTKEQLLKHSILSERSPAIALNEINVHVIDPNPMVGQILAPLTDMIATVLTDKGWTNMDAVYHGLQKLSTAANQDTWSVHLTSFVAAVQSARRIVGDESSIEDGLEAAEMLLGQDPRE